MTSRLYTIRMLAAAAMTIFIVGMGGTVYAACTTPAGTAGELIYNKDEHVAQYCDDTAWIAMGPVPGAGGAGCSNPTGGEAAIVYNADNNVMQYCDGAAWVGMGSSALPTPTTSGLIAHWEFDETSGTTAVDSTGNTDNDGTLTYDATWAPADGVIGGAILLDGSGDGVLIANGANAGAIGNETTYSGDEYQTATITGWTKSANASNTSYEFVMGFIAGVAYLAWEDGGPGTRALRGMTRNFDAGTANYFPVSIGTMTANQWIHFAYVFEDGVGYKVYLDGVLDRDISEPDVNMDHWNCPDGCNIGKFHDTDTGPYSFDGYIDDFRVYDRALTPQEVSALYIYGAGSSGGTCTSPAGSAGDMVYNADNNVMQYCNGAAWIGIGK